MSLLRYRRVLMSRTASDSRLNKWEGSFTVTVVVGLLSRSPNLPTETTKTKETMRRGGRTTWKKRKTWNRYLLSINYADPLPLLVTKNVIPFLRRSGTNSAIQPIAVLTSTTCWRNRQRDPSNVGLRENAKLHVFWVGCSPFPRLWPIRGCTKYRVAFDQRPSDGISECDAALVWAAPPGHRSDTEERWVCYHCARARQCETN